jgi:Flp pilus assembly protein TadD
MMALMMRAERPAAAYRVVRTVAGLTATLMLGACAQTGELLPKASLASLQSSDESEKPTTPQNELQKATAYWGQEYAKRPTALEPALSYARNLKALGEKQKALDVLQRAGSVHDGNRELAGEYGRLALDLDQVQVAARMLAIADDPTKPDWKVISARGTVLAKQGQYKQAIPFYERALALSQNQSSVLNNLAMAHAMGGDPKKAEELLHQAAATPGGNTAKVKQNLALVLGLQGRYDEAKQLTAGSSSAAADASQNVDVLRTFVKAPATATPSSVATAAPATPVADFKTQVSRAIASAPTAAQQATPSTPNVAKTMMKPASIEKASADAAPGWTTNVAAETSSSTALKGAAR